jgi:hypothetical protein
MKLKIRSFVQEIACYGESNLLNTIKPFSDHENRSSQKSFQGGYLRELEFLNSKYAGLQVGPKDSESQNFSLLGLMG